MTQLRVGRWLAGVGTALAVAACGNGTTAATTTDNDAQTTDTGALPDDATATDAQGVDAVDAGPQCPVEPAPLVIPPETCTGAGGVPYTEAVAPDPTRTKFAMSLFHFNIEYVIGGLEYLDLKCVSSVFTQNPDNVGWTNDKVEDFIVRESFLPILQMYDKHPDWGVDIELQAYMIDVMAARHPDVLDLLRKLAQRGQVELVSFHYNAQLFLAFPREDQKRSLDAVKATFKNHCLPLSGVVFNQEGQAGEGRQKMLVDEGWTVGVYPKNLFYYVHQDVQNPWPYFASEGGDLIVGGSGVDPASGVQITWNFLDDGELRAAPEVSGQALNPYFATNAAHDPARVAEFEKELDDTQKGGFYMARIGDYVRHLKAAKIVQKPAPALLDGTWQPKSTDSIHRWLGGRGLWGSDENDFLVRRGNYEARTQLAAVQVLADVAQAAGKGVADQDKRLTALWRALWRVEVSDCSGVNPWLAEVQWALDHNPRIIADAQTLAGELKGKLGWKSALVDLATRTAVEGTLPAETLTPAEPPADVTAVEVTVTGRTFTTTWSQVAPKHWRLAVALSAADPDFDPAGREVSVSFPHLDDVIAYSPGLLDDVVRSYTYSQFTFQQDHVWLPVPNGLIALGNGFWVIKHARQNHVAARVALKTARIDFADETLPMTQPVTWSFDLVQGTAEQALTVAHALNDKPQVSF